MCTKRRVADLFCFDFVSNFPKNILLIYLAVPSPTQEEEASWGTCLEDVGDHYYELARSPTQDPASKKNNRELQWDRAFMNQYPAYKHIFNFNLTKWVEDYYGPTPCPPEVFRECVEMHFAVNLLVRESYFKYTGVAIHIKDILFRFVGLDIKVNTIHKHVCERLQKSKAIKLWQQAFDERHQKYDDMDDLAFCQWPLADMAQRGWRASCAVEDLPSAYSGIRRLNRSHFFVDPTITDYLSYDTPKKLLNMREMDASIGIPAEEELPKSPTKLLKPNPAPNDPATSSPVPTAVFGVPPVAEGVVFPGESWAKVWTMLAVPTTHTVLSRDLRGHRYTLTFDGKSGNYISPSVSVAIIGPDGNVNICNAVYRKSKEWIVAYRRTTDIDIPSTIPRLMYTPTITEKNADVWNALPEKLKLFGIQRLDLEWSIVGFRGLRYVYKSPLTGTMLDTTPDRDEFTGISAERIYQGDQLYFPDLGFTFYFSFSAFTLEKKVPKPAPNDN